MTYTFTITQKELKALKNLAPKHQVVKDIVQSIEAQDLEGEYKEDFVNETLKARKSKAVGKYKGPGSLKAALKK